MTPRRTVVATTLRALLLAVTLNLVCHAPARAQDAGALIDVTVENDFFSPVANFDRYYSNGIRFSYIGADGWEPRWLRSLSRLNRALLPLADASRHPMQQDTLQQDPAQQDRSGLFFGHQLYTPSDTDAVAFLPGDQPYAAWLYAGASVTARSGQPHDWRQQQILELSIGVTGPPALGEEVQNTYHRLINVPLSRGWDNQLPFEPVLQASLIRQWRLPLVGQAQGGSALEVDIIPEAGLYLGTAHLAATGGAVLRIGQNLGRDPGPTRLGPALGGSPAFDSAGPMRWSIFFGGQARAQAHNLFLDGTVFRGSESVPSDTLITDYQLGASLTFRWGRVSFTHIWRSRQFDGQLTPHRFGALTLAFAI